MQRKKVSSAVKQLPITAYRLDIEERSRSKSECWIQDRELILEASNEI